MELHEFEEKFRNVDSEIGKAGDEWAEARLIWRQLDDYTKPFLAKLMSEYNGSNASRERQAQIRIEYLDHLKGVAVAEYKMIKAKNYLDRMYARFEAYRSLNSVEKKKVNLL